MKIRSNGVLGLAVPRGSGSRCGEVRLIIGEGNNGIFEINESFARASAARWATEKNHAQTCPTLPKPAQLCPTLPKLAQRCPGAPSVQLIDLRATGLLDFRLSVAQVPDAPDHR